MDPYSKFLLFANIPFPTIMSILSAMTTLELCDTVAGTAYIGQLLFTPEAFMRDNFKDGGGGGGASMCRYAGVFLIGLRLNSILLQTKAPGLRKEFSRNAAIVWGLCGVLSVMFWDEGKTPNLYVNLGLQCIFTAGFLWQAYGK